MEAEKPERKPDNTLTMDINGTKYIIEEYLNGKETVNDIIAKRVKRELEPAISGRENG